jgi:hypothetical protein
MSDTGGAPAPKNQAKDTAEEEGSAGPDLSNSATELADLGNKATKAHEQIRAGKRDAFEHAVAAGKALLAAKKVCLHGEWEKWCKRIGIPPRTASQYMLLAENHARILSAHKGSKSAGSAGLTIDRALRLLRPPKNKGEKREPRIPLHMAWSAAPADKRRQFLAGLGMEVVWSTLGPNLQAELIRHAMKQEKFDDAA